MRPELSASLRTGLEARRARIVPRIQHMPPPGARPLVILGRVAGWAAPPAIQAIAGLDGVHTHLESIELMPAGKLDELLARIAKTLHDAGCARSWRGELLNVVGEGRWLGRMERAAFRPLGLLTQAVHLNGWTPDGKIWIARRAATKSTDPGMWDTLAGGLAASDESLDQALLRESHEEAGLAPTQLTQRSGLRLVSRLHKRLPEGYQVEDALVCDCVLAEGDEPCNLDGEVDEFLCADMDTVWQLLQADSFTVEAEWVLLDSLLR